MKNEFERLIKAATELRAVDDYLNDDTKHLLMQITDKETAIASAFKLGFSNGYKGRTEEIMSLLDELITDIENSSIK